AGGGRCEGEAERRQRGGEMSHLPVLPARIVGCTRDETASARATFCARERRCGRASARTSSQGAGHFLSRRPHRCHVDESLIHLVVPLRERQSRERRWPRDHPGGWAATGG